MYENINLRTRTFFEEKIFEKYPHDNSGSYRKYTPKEILPNYWRIKTKQVLTIFPLVGQVNYIMRRKKNPSFGCFFSFCFLVLKKHVPHFFFENKVGSASMSYFLVHHQVATHSFSLISTLISKKNNSFILSKN